VVTNLGSGVLLQIRGALEAGDLIKIRETLGTVHEINARSVVLDTRDGRRVHIPNREVLEHSIENYTTRGRRRSSFHLLIDPSDGLATVLHEATAAVDSCPGVAPEPAPTVEIAEFVGRYAQLRVRIWHDWPLATGDAAVHRAATRVVDALSNAGVALAGPEVIGLPAARRPDHPES
jgi:small-conductance mechanosensitive channel